MPSCLTSLRDDQTLTGAHSLRRPSGGISRADCVSGLRLERGARVCDPASLAGREGSKLTRKPSVGDLSCVPVGPCRTTSSTPSTGNGGHQTQLLLPPPSRIQLEPLVSRGGLSHTHTHTTQKVFSAPTYISPAANQNRTTQGRPPSPASSEKKAPGPHTHRRPDAGREPSRDPGPSIDGHVSSARRPAR